MATPDASIYISDLHSDVTEEMLFQKFSTAGPIISIQVCREMITKQSLGSAYVRFQKPSDAERALDTMNFDTLHGRQMRIIWAQRGPGLPKSGVGNVFIKNLHENIDSKALYDIFSAFGNIVSCQIMTDETGQSKGSGFVHFETQEAADAAIRQVNGMILVGKEISVGSSTPSDQRTDVQEQRKFSNIFIKNFGNHLNEEKLRELLSKYGNVVALRIVYDEDEHSKGFGFCTFEKSEEAEAAIEHLNGYPVGKKQLFVQRFLKKSERRAETKQKKDAAEFERASKSPGSTLYIKHLDDTITAQKLEEEFSKFGTITSTKIATSENGQSKGYAFVCFSTSDEATNAVMKMNGTLLGTKVISVGLAQRKEERQVHLNKYYMKRGGPLQQPASFIRPAGIRPTNYHPAFPSSIIIPADLTNATPQEQKQMLGERLFPLIQQIQPELAGKLTGMILELDNTELLHMLQSPESLKSKVDEAFAVLQAHQAKQVVAAATNTTN